MNKDEWYAQLFERLGNSKFRSRFHLKQKDVDHINEKGMDREGICQGNKGNRVNETKDTIICYGDSNTYGYDPRLGGGGRYPKEERWPDILAERLGCRMENQGLCGRCIPTVNSQIRQIKSLLDEWRDTESPVQIWVIVGGGAILGVGVGAGVGGAVSAVGMGIEV
jgi:hypothetical protein